MNNPCIDCGKVADAFMCGMKPKAIEAICAACPFSNPENEPDDDDEQGED